MGYAYYELEGMKRGYGVGCVCHKRGCQKQIDRGLSYLCYRCLWYFCAAHLTFAERAQECFAGESGQVCQRCARVIEKEVGSECRGGEMTGLTFRELIAANLSRVERWHGLHDWSALEWAGAMAGECGEACNAAKKYKRVVTGVQNINLETGRSLTTLEDAARKVGLEVADTIIYSVLLCARVGVDLEDCIREAFNKKSEEYGFPERLPLPASPEDAPAPTEPRTFKGSAFCALSPEGINHSLCDGWWGGGYGGPSQRCECPCHLPAPTEPQKP